MVVDYWELLPHILIEFLNPRDLEIWISNRVMRYFKQIFFISS